VVEGQRGEGGTDVGAALRDAEAVGGKHVGEQRAKPLAGARRVFRRLR
jgi:hypothetical protein